MLCFDTRLQVFILKVDRGGHENRREKQTKAKKKDNAEAQGAPSLRREEGAGWLSRKRDMVGYPPTRVSSKGIAGCHTPAFWEKSLEAVENKGREPEKEQREIKSPQVAEILRVRGGAVGGVREVSSR